VSDVDSGIEFFEGIGRGNYGYRVRQARDRASTLSLLALILIVCLGCTGVARFTAAPPWQEKDRDAAPQAAPPSAVPPAAWAR